MKLPKGFSTLVKPYPHQIEGIAYGIIRNQAGILYGTGLGKTYIAINIARYRIKNNNVSKTLVISPPSILLNWKEEVEKYSEYNAIILHSPIRKDRIKLIEEFNNNDSLQFGLINYEALFRYGEFLDNLDLRMGIFDESARYIRNLYSSTRDGNNKIKPVKRTQAAIYLADKIKYKLVLTATPIANNPIDVWSQFRVLDFGRTFGLNFYAFRNKYFYKLDLGAFSKWVVKDEKIKELHNKIFSTCIYKKKEECIEGLPRQIFRTIKIPMTKDLEKTYETVRSKIVSEIDTSIGKATINAKSILTKLLRLQQITGGFIKDVGGNEIKLKDTPKLNATIEYVEEVIEAQESVVIFCRFVKSLKLIQEELNKKRIKSLVMYGDSKDKSTVWKKFQTSDIPVFICQIESGGIGINLFKVDSSATYQHVIFYENISPEARQQAIGRIHRIGQNSICVYISMVIKDSYDERVLSVISQGEKLADMIMKKGYKYLL